MLCEVALVEGVFAGAEAGFCGVVADVSQHAPEVLAVAQDGVEVVVLPKLPAFPDEWVDALCRPLFPRMDELLQMPPGARDDGGVDVVGHDDKGHDIHTLAIEMPHRIGDYRATLGPTERAVPAPFIEASLGSREESLAIFLLLARRPRVRVCRQPGIALPFEPDAKLRRERVGEVEIDKIKCAFLLPMREAILRPPPARLGIEKL